MKSVACTVLFVASSVNAGITQNAKKSIFPTTDASRENDFIDAFFAPLINIGVVDSVSAGDIYTCGVPSKYRFETNGFEIHSPYAPYHDSGGLEVDVVESYYKEKWDNLMSQDNDWNYDAILDNNMAFWVMDLSTFDGYGQDLIDRVYLEWEWEDNTYYSMIVHNKADRADMNQFELISDTFSGLEKKTHSGSINLIKSEPRAAIDDIHTNYKEKCEANDYPIIEMSIRKAVSDVDANIEWYSNVFAGVITDTDKQIKQGEFIDVNGNSVKYGHIIVQQDDTFQISFFERKGIKSTYGTFTIEEFESKLKEAHKEVMVNPFCCVDRWYDLHYAMPLNDDVAAARTLENVMLKDDEIYTVFEITKSGGENEGKGMFWTMMEPNGQIVQLQGPDSESNYVGVEFVVQPSYWDGEWCPQENKDEFKQYSFGDRVATITIYEKGDIIDDKVAELELELKEEEEEAGLVEKNGVWKMRMQARLGSLLPSLVAIVTVALVLVIVYCIRSTVAQNDHLVSYTYKTFN